MNIYYWCPFIDYVATVKAVLNSSLAINKFSNKNNESIIINSVGEWDQYSDYLRINKIKQIKLIQSKRIYKNLPRNSYFKSRLSYIIISISSIFSLIKFLKKRNEDDLIVLHLITSLPLLLINIFNFRCKFVLRISGHPKLNMLRKFLWKISEKKLNKIFVPTIETRNKLINTGIFREKNLLILRDPIVDIFEVKKKINNSKKMVKKKNTIISIGRLTKQKNHTFLIKSFAEILKENKDLKLKILGKGELEKDLKNLIYSKKLNENIELVGHVENIYEYLNNSFCFILTSRWEDPGFVIIESAVAKTLILSSDCESGPKEFIEENEKCGYLYKEGDMNSFISKFKNMYQESISRPEVAKEKKFYALKKSKLYTKYSHFKKFNEFLTSLKN